MEYQEQPETLSPEERVKAQVIAREVIAESSLILRGMDEVYRVDPEGRPLNLQGKKKLANTIFKDAELKIERYQPMKEFSFEDLYVFYPDHVDHIRSEVGTSPGPAPHYSTMAPGSEPSRSAEKSREADEQDLTDLLKAVMHSRPK